MSNLFVKKTTISALPRSDKLKKRNINGAAYTTITSTSSSTGGSVNSSLFPKKSVNETITGIWDFKGGLKINGTILKKTNAQLYIDNYKIALYDGALNADSIQGILGNRLAIKDVVNTFTKPQHIDFQSGQTIIGDISIFDTGSSSMVVDMDIGCAGFMNMEEGVWILRTDSYYYNTYVRKIGIGEDFENQRLEGALNVDGSSVFFDILKGNGTFRDGFGGENWQLSPNKNGLSHLVIDNLTVRRMAKFYELEIDEITHTGGSRMASAAHGIVTTVSGNNLYFDTDNGNNPIQFQIGDNVIAQTYTGKGIGSFRGAVTAVNQTLGYITITTITGNPYDGMKLVQAGHPTDTSRQAMIFETVMEGDSPYISFLSGVTDGTFDGKQVVQLGDLSIINHAYWGQLSGVGLMVNHGYFDNVHVRGTIEVTGGNAATQTQAKQYANAAQINAQLYIDSEIDGLGSMAFEDIIQLAHLGTTIIKGGYILTNLLDVNAIRVSGGLSTETYAASKAASARAASESYALSRANLAQANAIANSNTYTDTKISNLSEIKQDAMVNGKTLISGGYLNTQFIDTNWLHSTVINTSYIEGLNLNFTKGTVGGFTLSSNSLTGGDGTGDRFVLYPTNYLAFLDSNGDKWAGIGQDVLPAYVTSNAVARFEVTKWSNEGISAVKNTALILNANSAGVPDFLDGSYEANGYNEAIYIYSGDINLRQGNIRAYYDWSTLSLSGKDYNYLEIHKALKWSVVAGGSTYSILRLPTKTQMESKIGTQPKSFDIEIRSDRLSTKDLRIQPNSGVLLYDQNGNSTSYISLAKGDAVRLVFDGANWNLINHNY